MGETLADIERHERKRGSTPKLVGRQKADGVRRLGKILIDRLDFFYGQTQALRRVCLTVPQHQVTGMIGSSRCGKATLLRVLNRIYSMYPRQRATGTALLDGSDIIGSQVDPKRLRSRVGRVFQDINVFPFSIYENVAFEVRLHEDLSHAEMAMRVQETLVRVALWEGVKNRLQTPAGALSGGQQQRLCLVRALSTGPEVLLMDEPTSALYPRSMMQIENLIDQLKQAVTIVLVTHNLQQAARCADQVAFFYLGQSMKAGSAEQMFMAPKLPKTQNYITGRFG